MRRVTSLLSGLALLALGLGLSLSPAAADEEQTCRGEIVVQLDAWVWARPGHDSFTYALAVPLPAGEWAVNTRSFDGYEGREGTSQDHEQWMLQLIDGGVVVATIGPTTDIPDGVDHGESADNLGIVVLETGADALRVVHFIESTDDGNESVHAGCVGFEPVPPPAPSTTTTSLPTSTTTSTSTTTTSTTTPSVTTTFVPGGPGSTSTTTTSAPGGPGSTPTPSTPTTSTPGGVTQGPGEHGGDASPGEVIASLGSIPRLRATLDCSTRAIVAEITNIGDAVAVVDVFLVSDSVHTGVQVAPGSVAEIDFELPSSAESTTLDLLVSDQRGAVDTDSVLVDCEQPSLVTASTGVDCVAGSLTIDLSNDGQEADLVSVIVEQLGLIDTVTLPGGQSERVSIDIGAMSSIPLRVVGGDGSDVLRRSIPIDCPAPVLSVSTSVSCATSEILIMVHNTGDAAAMIDARLDGEGVQGVVVAPAGSTVIGLPFRPGTTSQVLRLAGASSLEASSGEILIGCQPGDTELLSPCSSIAISSSPPSTSTIVSAPTPGGPWWIETGPIGASGTMSRAEASRSCATPDVEFSANCAFDTLTIRMSNTGSIATRLVVLVDGEATGSGFDLAPATEVVTSVGISDAKVIDVFEAGRVEPLAMLRLSCGSGGKGLRTAAYAVFSLSVLASLLSAVLDPRRLLSIFR